ncbi:unnamed protein product [Clonostachys byssicola]|uniref:Uncharacterized protein n=1 Tax=Clonostachys byssicola TaxID=160290 RepID=A0A9N9U896_9HYPO|nr:unnamed protein product [Clonostachys byssicola]
MGTLLEAGADVDAIAPCDPSDFDEWTPVYSSGYLPPGLHTTIVESVFYRHPHFFNQFLRYSRVRQGQLSQARLLQAAVEGCEELRAYLQTITADTSEINWHLESCLAKTFSLKETPDSCFIGRRMQLVRNLLFSDVDPTLPSACGVLSIQAMFNVLIGWGYQWLGKKNEPLPRCFNEVQEQLLRHGALWDESDWDTTICMYSLGILPLLGTLGFDIRSLDGRALCRAAVIGNLEAVRWLLDAGADVNATWTRSDGLSNVLFMGQGFQWKSAETGLFESCTVHYGPIWAGKAGMIKVILALGPDLRYPHAGDPDLLEACFIHYPQLGEETNCCLAAIELLLEQGAPVSSSALAAVIGLGGQSDLVNQLIHKGSDVHSYAIERRQLSIDHGVGFRVVDQAFSPVQAAVYRNNPERISLLLERGADINQPGFNDRGVTALQAACQIEEQYWKPGTRLRMVKFLLKLGAYADGLPAQKNGFSALQIAAANGDLEIALMLLHSGADPNTLDTDDRRVGITALDFAAEQGRLDMLQLLLTFGGRSGSPGKTGVDGAIELARERRCFAIVKYLEAHADSISDSFGDWTHSRFSQLDARFGFNDITRTFL